MKVGVLGAGNGGLATAFDWANAGHEVSLFDFEEFPKNIADVQKAGGIHAKGELNGFKKLVYAGHEIAPVVADADLIFVVGPAYSTEPFANAAKPYAKAGQIYVICPGSCAGSIVFKNALGLELDDESIIVAETSTLPYAVRITGEAEVTIYNRLKGSYYIAALPSKCNEKMYSAVGEVFKEAELAENVLQTTLQNANPIIHPSVSLLNAALVERTGGDFLFYEEGVTPAVGRIIKALDEDRIRIGEKLGVKVVRDPVLAQGQGYMVEDNYDTGYSKAPGFKGIMAQPQLDHRFLNEDAGYGLVFFADLARHIGVEVPAVETVLSMASLAMGRDYKAEAARTMETLKLSKYDPETLKKVI